MIDLVLGEATASYLKRKFMIRCDNDTCGEVAVWSWIFRAPDGRPLSRRWNRCREHASEPLPENLPFGAVVELSGPREID